MAKLCHFSYSGGPDWTLPDLGIFPRHISPPPPSSLPQLERRRTRWHPPRLQSFKSSSLTLFSGLCQIPAKSVWKRCWHFSALLERIPLLLSHSLRNKQMKWMEAILYIINFFWVCFSYYYRYGIPGKCKNRKQTTYSAAMLTQLFGNRSCINLKNVSPWQTTVIYIYLHTCQDIVFLDD